MLAAGLGPGSGADRTRLIAVDAGKLAEWICFMVSDPDDFLCGSVVFVDVGSDAFFRPDDWPRAVPLRRRPRYLWRFKRSGAALRRLGPHHLAPSSIDLIGSTDLVPHSSTAPVSITRTASFIEPEAKSD